MSKKPETKFQERVLKDLKKRKLAGKKLFFTKISQRSIRGIPDLYILANGHPFHLELKIPGGKVDGLQAYRIEEIRYAGGFSYVVQPHEWLAVLTEIDRRLQE